MTNNNGFIEVSVLGEKYTIYFCNREDDEKLTECNGYCDTSVKKIVVQDFVADKMSICDLKYLQNKVIRHEIIHAFLYESGLSNNSEWAENEEMVDWFAIQMEKIYGVCFDAGSVEKVGVL